MKYRIVSYSSYGTYKKVAETENISSIVDHMIRVTAKVTEMYANHIIYDVNALTKAVEEGNSFARVLRFREAGVDSRYVFDSENVEVEDNSGTIQAWSLTHNPEMMETIFERVLLIRAN